MPPSPRATSLERLARTVANALTRDQQPPVEEIDELLDADPDLLLETIDALAQRYAKPRIGEDALAAAYVYILEQQLRQLSYNIGAGYDDDRALYERFERRLVELIRSGTMPPMALLEISHEMRAARLRPGPALRAAAAATLTDGETAPTAVTVADVEPLMKQLSVGVGNDPFAVVEALTEVSYLYPVELRSVLVEAMLSARTPAFRDAAVLALLDSEPEVRGAVAAALAANAAALSEVGLRRLEAIRDWLPAGERADAGRAVEAARAAGRSPAPWGDGAHDTEIHASVIDGTSTQGFFVVLPEGKRRRVASIMLRNGSGVLDAWRGEPQSKGETAAMLDEAAASAPHRRVGREYLDRAVCRALKDGADRGEAPPPGLLRVAEELGAAGWRPADIDWRATLATLVEAAPESARTPEAVDLIVAASADWGIETGLTESWFEDDPAVQEALFSVGDDDPDEVLRRVLDDVIEPRKEKWTEHFAETALWLKEGGTPNPAWPYFAILAAAIESGRAAADVPLLEIIALASIEAAAEEFPEDELP